MELPKRAIRVSDEDWTRFLAVPGKTLGDKLLSLLNGLDVPRDTRIDSLLESMTKLHTHTSELLEHAQSQVSLEDIQTVVEDALQAKIEERQAQRTSNPASIPGVTVGQYPPAPAKRESSFERAQREAREREQRARDRSSVGDDPAYSFDLEFVQD